MTRWTAYLPWRIVRDVYRFDQEERKRPAANAEKQAEFAKWEKAVTDDEIRALFLATLTEGNEDLHGPVIQHRALLNFDKIVAELTRSSNGELEMRSIMEYLVRVHEQADRNKAVLGASSALESLINSHTHFPFTTPVVLTRDALLRAILLITHCVDDPFKQSSQINSDDEIRPHSEKERLRFIYSALACPPTGVPTQDDVLDIVSRVKYPWQTWGKGIVRRKLLEELRPLAERLETASDVETPKSIPVGKIEPLRELAKAFPRRWGDAVEVVDFGGRDNLTLSRFVKWAIKVELLDVLDQVFGVLISAGSENELASDLDSE